MEDKNIKDSDSTQKKYKRKNHSANESNRIQETNSFNTNNNEHNSSSQSNRLTEGEDSIDKKQDEQTAESFQ